MTRLEKALAKLKSCDYDALYISSEINQRYVTEFAFTDGFVLITKEKSYVVTDFRYIEAAREKVIGDFEIIGERRADLLKTLCAENHVKSLGFEDGNLSYAGYKSLKGQLEGVELVPAGRFIEALRLYKDKEEVENITKAQRIAEKAFAETIPYI
ncbi:MAG: aminopeptidase P family N-terminal domain-containing protein, partial [Firmicutes bacterium]|nr:aminopeptidase P family N-terminal domain-containing protein [Bacillota bacterium]